MSPEKRKNKTGERFLVSGHELLEFMQAASYKPLSFKELTRAFDVPKEAREGFKRLLKGMIDDGSLIKIRGGRYGAPSKMNLVTGEVICHPDGYGFVKPEDEEGKDVFINQRGLSGAMHGDTVIARVDGYKDGGKKREGKVIRVVKRAHKTVVGNFELSRGFGIVVPSDERIIDRIIIPPDSIGKAMPGTVVVAEITRWPARQMAPAGKIIEVLGDPESPDVEAEVILRKYGLPNRFSHAVMAEVRSVPMAVAGDEAKGRVDLRDKKVFTIDGETAKDFDDAVNIERTEKGYRLRVSIADVSHYVKPGTEIDTEAYARGTSVYFPDRAIPMLPEALSNGICSLNPGVDRLTMTAEIEFDSKGNPTKKRFYESVIKSSERLTYTNVKKVLLNEDAELSKRYAHIAGELKLMEELAEKLTQKRMEKGSIDFDLPEPQIILDIEGRIEDIVKSERNIAHRIIEEFMLAANRAVAEEFSSRDYPFLYRVHDEPDEESIHDFVEFAAGFGVHFKIDGGPKAFQKVLSAVVGRKEEKLINHVLLRSMKQAVYSEENIGHFGLAFDDYTHFTSPIRRYPDLVVHRLLKSLLRTGYEKHERDRMEKLLPAIASHTSVRERKAMEAEREIVDLKKAQFMSDKVGDEFEGFVSGVTSFGIFVELKDFFVEGLVHVSTLVDDYYIFEEKQHSLIGENTKKRFRLGDEVRVLLSKVDIERRRIDLELAEGLGRDIKTRAGRSSARRRRR